MSKNQAEICKTFFKLLENERDAWLCKCGRKLKQRKGTGWSNSYAHIKVHYRQKTETAVNNLPDQPTLIHPIYGIVSKKAQHLYRWLDCVCMELGSHSSSSRVILQENKQLATNLSEYFNSMKNIEMWQSIHIV